MITAVPSVLLYSAHTRVLLLCCCGSLDLKAGAMMLLLMETYFAETLLVVFFLTVWSRSSMPVKGLCVVDLSPQDGIRERQRNVCKAEYRAGRVLGMFS